MNARGRDGWVEKDNTRDFGTGLTLPSMPAHQSMLLAIKKQPCSLNIVEE